MAFMIEMYIDQLLENILKEKYLNFMHPFIGNKGTDLLSIDNIYLQNIHKFIYILSLLKQLFRQEGKIASRCIVFL